MACTAVWQHCYPVPDTLDELSIKGNTTALKYPQSNAALLWSEKQVSVPSEPPMLQSLEDTAPYPLSQILPPLKPHILVPTTSTAKSLVNSLQVHAEDTEISRKLVTFEGKKPWGNQPHTNHS